MSEARYTGMQRCLAGTASCMQMFFKCMVSATEQNGDQLVTPDLFCTYDLGHATCTIYTEVPSCKCVGHCNGSPSSLAPATCM